MLTLLQGVSCGMLLMCGKEGLHEGGQGQYADVLFAACCQQVIGATSPDQMTYGLIPVVAGQVYK